MSIVNRTLGSIEGCYQILVALLRILVVSPPKNFTVNDPLQLPRSIEDYPLSLDTACFDNPCSFFFIAIISQTKQNGQAKT